MTDRTNALAHALFKKPTLQECSLQQIDYLAHQYPYFSTAQLLLLQKTEPDTEAYAQQLQRTALHFSQSLQLQFWLQPHLFNTTFPKPQLFQKPIPDASVAEPEQSAAPQEAAVANLNATIVETPPVEPDIEVQQETIELPEPPQPEAIVAAAAMPSPQPQAPAIVEGAPEQEAPAAGAITFEPYHTVDYFASQGIKLSQQEATADKLGKQLKSFTEWLKTMKRLPEAAVTRNEDAAVERNVEHLAAHSLDSADVVTESMAEVWLKQGNKEKAADVYNKLSLRHPAKSAYFAAKIEALKPS